MGRKVELSLKHKRAKSLLQSVIVRKVAHGMVKLCLYKERRKQAKLARLIVLINSSYSVD